ncbi:acid sphingomyelinase-like phosphodiesterase 3b [Plakobranchus ocellatus]|uniref:Acid sphingomyelinase-like phosphodiesterase 3b n=1 Tax=Plakobranchus ocellatus TaxID=259542 RepID=A0AAV4C395_9GAST|nr:acid sphingomyelinase-like phosphodiesterase 3b [Plakobranchus ocellatus]
MADIKPDADFILWTGDTAGHIPTPEFSLERNLQMINIVTSTIKRIFPNTLVIPSLGNHDFFPADYTNGTESELYDSVCQMWSAWIKDPEQINNCRRVVNTVLYLIENPMTRDLDDPSRQFEWLESTLVNARLAGEKVIITGHVSPTIHAPSVLNWFYPQYQNRYVKLMTLFSDLIIAHHYGHEHKDLFKILQRDEDESGASPVFLPPPVTPLRRTPPDGEQGPPLNPGVRLVKYDRLTGKHLNYRQFYTNITEDNRLGRAVWDKKIRRHYTSLPHTSFDGIEITMFSFNSYRCSLIPV